MTARDLDRVLELRERLVEVLDGIDRGDPGTARFFAQGILDDLDAAVMDDDRVKDGGDPWIL